MDPAPAPLADLIVTVDGAEPGPGGSYPLAPGLAPATVRVREVDWDAAKTSGIAPGDELWLGAPAELLSTGAAEILLGLGERRADGLWSVRFAVAPSGQGATVIGPSPFAERQTAILEAFRTSEDNPASGASARDLILAWNEEVARGGGPIGEAWERFVGEVVLGHVPDPAPGTRAWVGCRPADVPERARRARGRAPQPHVRDRLGARAGRMGGGVRRGPLPPDLARIGRVQRAPAQRGLALRTLRRGLRRAG